MTEDQKNLYRGVGSILMASGVIVVGVAALGWLGLGLSLMLVGAVFIAALRGQKKTPTQAEK